MPTQSSMTEAELDRIAAGIRPSWELDDAPFRPSGMASPQLDALLAGAALGHANGHASHTNGAGSIAPQAITMIQAAEPEDLRTTIDPVPPTALVEAPLFAQAAQAAQATPIEAVMAPMPVPTAQIVAEAKAVSERPPPSSKRPPPPVPSTSPSSQRPSDLHAQKSASVSAQADPFAAPAEKSTGKSPRAKSTSSSDFQAIQKSNKGLYIALGGGAVVALIAIIAVASSSSKPDTTVRVEPSAKIGAAAQTREIPPPPATEDLPAATAQPTVTAPAPTQAADLPAPTATQVAQAQTATPSPSSTHASNPPHPNPTTHASSPPPNHPNPPASGGGGRGRGGIVRDVPF